MERDGDPILFYESDYYFLSNFSSFAIMWKGLFCLTAEHAYQMEKYEDEKVRALVRGAMSAHDSKKVARSYADKRKPEWDEIKLGVMHEIIREKVKQHPYIKEKLLESGDRALIESSPKDSFWGWGKDKKGENQLGKIWMKVREELREER